LYSLASLSGASVLSVLFSLCFFFFQAEDGIRDFHVTGVQTCALPIFNHRRRPARAGRRPMHMSKYADMSVLREGGPAPSLRTSIPGTQLERVPVLIFDDIGVMARQVARRIANLIEEGKTIGKQVVLGLPTGSTPIGVYHQLIRMHRDEGLDFSNVIT